MQSMSREARGVADRLITLSEQLKDPALELESHHCRWATQFLLGEVAGTLEHTRIGIEMYEPAVHS